MKNPILIIALLSLAMFVNAQNTEYAFIRYKYMWGYFDLSFGLKSNKEKLVRQNVSGYTETTVTKKGNFLSTKVIYDKNGNTLSYENYDRKGNLQMAYLYSYNSDNLPVSQTLINGKDKEKKKILVSYDSLKNPIGEEFYKNEKLLAKTISKFDSTRIVESYFFKKGSPDFEKKWMYTYYPDKTRKSSVIFNSKGNVVYTWSYDCKPEGEQMVKHKDTTDVCKKVEYDSLGNKTITWRKFDEKGRTYKTVAVFDKFDQQLEYRSYDHKDRLDHSYKFTEGSTTIGESIRYKKGKENYRYLYLYDDNENLIVTVGFHKGVKVNQSEYTYNEKNLVSERIWKGKSSKLFSSTKYEYTVF